MKSLTGDAEVDAAVAAAVSAPANEEKQE